MRVVVLGSTGMLGSEVARICKLSGLEVVEVSRTRNIIFDFFSDSFTDLAMLLNLGEGDYVVNCIGWIPQRAEGNESLDRFAARHLNVELPTQINQGVQTFGFSWIQIATDCAFSGESGNYTEVSPKDARDLYGVTKIAGELQSASAMQVRTSIVGPDHIRNAGLYAWFKSAVKSGQPVTGFTNQKWNGVSTTAFARLVVGLVSAGERSPIAVHWSPADEVSKFRLLSLFAKHLGLPADTVIPGIASVDLNRTLSTKFPARNLQLWNLAGFEREPSIEELVAELVELDQAREFHD
jgi:dTDP-4-dehydrorhamnose reductase